MQAAADFRYLVMVTPDNHNKYYKMVPEGNSFTAEYGRVGARPQKKVYSMADFYRIYDEKIAKGYSDQTALHDAVVTATSGTTNFEPIADSSVQWLMDTLMNYANKVIDRHYKVKVAEVTSQMIDKAEDIIDNLVINKNHYTVSVFNDYLLHLFAIIPRKMSDVNDYLAKDTSNYAEIIQNEYDLLDVMKSQVSSTQRGKIQHRGKGTILDALGLEIRPCTQDESDKICEKLTAESADKFKRAWRVINKKQEEKYLDYCKTHKISKRNEHFLYHGSRNMNYYGIITEGLKLNPNAPINGKMFGHGLYFAPRAKKSIGYTSLKGSFWASGNDNTAFLLVYKVAYKNLLDVISYNSNYGNLRYADIKNSGKDALFAHKGQMLVNDEVIVYREDQCTLRYIIELTR